QKKIAKNQFNFDDFLQQIQQIQKMGNVKDLMGMLPGMGKAMKDVDIEDDAFKHIEAIIFSMTPKEREQPDIINGSRKKRIAKGCGREITDVNQLMKQFNDTKKMMKLMNNKSAMASMMKQFGGMPGMPGGQ
ncbi:MAG: signal recognition particle subunit SRP54, partial [Halieaceae bacterium]